MTTSVPGHEPLAVGDPAAVPLPRDDSGWATAVSRLRVDQVPIGVRGINVDGRRLNGPVQGFGKMWQKTYRFELPPSVDPEAVVAEWKAHFPEFWPQGNAFHGSLTGISPGDVALLTLTMPGHVTLSTGVMVLYADRSSFTLMTPQGHMFSGWITFAAERIKDVTRVQAQVLMRASDPLYEIGLILGGHRKEDNFWRYTLAAVAERMGTTGAHIDAQTVVVDRKRQWRRIGNTWHNAMIRSVLYTLGAPIRVAVRAVRRQH
jgi:hypothetical protein